MIAFDAPSLTISWEPEDRIIHAKWKGKVDGDEMRRGLEAGLALIVEKEAHRWLADNTELDMIDPADVKWVNDQWVPRAVRAGLSSMAVHMAKRVVMQMVAKSFMARIDDRELTNTYFDNVDAARDWLRKQA
ncbi:MAG TPA: STAS/SEC14 domain-containing protein [Labilithrix sp.]|nr:STAS/SEC14 domain-containing protein [Labilithrix sp.]